MFSLFGGKGRDQRFKRKSSKSKKRVSGKRKNQSGSKPKASSRDSNCVAGFGYNPETGRCVKLPKFGPVYHGPCRKGWAINLETGLCHKV